MRITELLQDATIDLGVKVNSKEEAIDHLVDLMVKGGNITDREEYKKGILAREANGTTGIGGGIAIPHSKNKAVTKAGLASMTVPDGVDYEAMDGEPSDVFFMIAAPAEGSDVHLEALSRLSVILMDPVFKDSLLKATSKEEYLALIDKKETEKFPEEAAKRNLLYKKRKQTMERSEFLQLQHAQQESLIHSWQQNLLRIKQKRWELH